MESKYYHSKGEISSAFEVSMTTVHGWVRKKTFPKKDGRADGWSKEKVTEWVDAHNERQAARIAPSGDRAEKTKLECERLRVVIKREKESLKVAELETQERAGKLADVAELERKYRLKAETLRALVDGWSAHNSAKHPEHADIIESLASDFIAMIYEG